MQQYAAIYGYEITRPINVCGFKITPVANTYQDAKKLARDLSSYNLTAIISSDDLSNESLFKLEAILSFIEHLSVLISKPVSENFYQSNAEPFPASLVLSSRTSGGGAVIASDSFRPKSRETFIKLAFEHLSNEAFCNSTKFKHLFYKTAETVRQHRTFVDITYFLLYSGLETYCRAIQNDFTSSNSSGPIHKTLKGLSFNVYQDNPSDLPRSISSYTHLRNKLFHNSEYEKTVKINNDIVTLHISDYLFRTSMLASLTVMKAIGFDDGHTNWDCWIDRQLHI